MWKNHSHQLAPKLIVLHLHLYYTKKERSSSPRNTPVIGYNLGSICLIWRGELRVSYYSTTRLVFCGIFTAKTFDDCS